MLKDKKLIYNIIRGLLVFFIFWNSVYLQLIPVLIFNLDVNNLSMKTQVMLSTFSSVVVAIILFFIYKKELKEDFKKFKDNLLENIDTGFRCWILGLVVMMVSNLLILFLFNSGGANNENAVQSMLKSFPALMFITSTFLAPFNEELVFRKTIKDVFKNKWVFVALSFILFGGAHVISSAESLVDYLYIIPYGALGAAFALAYYKTDTVFTSMCCHMVHNGVLVLISIISLVM
jgi:membrane protease YdiL (CAAX protease family)